MKIVIFMYFSRQAEIEESKLTTASRALKPLHLAKNTCIAHYRVATISIEVILESKNTRMDIHKASKITISILTQPKRHGKHSYQLRMSENLVGCQIMKIPIFMFEQYMSIFNIL